MSPTWRAAAGLGALAVLALLLPWVALGLAAALAVAVVVDARTARRKTLVVERLLPRLLSRGVTDLLEVRSLDPAGHRWELAQPSSEGIEIGPLHAVGQGVWWADVVAGRRGRHVLGPLQVRIPGPWQLGSWTHEAVGETAITVYPDLPTARRLARPVRTLADSSGTTVRGPLGLGTDFEALRDYLPDDDVRLVNWRATARMGRPMSNTFRVEQSRKIWLALDCGRLMAGPADGQGDPVSRFDVAVDVLAAIALSADAVGDRCGLLAYDEVPRTVIRPHVGGGARVLQALAHADVRLVDADLESAFAATTLRGSRAAIVLVTDLVDEASVRTLAGTLRVAALRHDVLVVSAASVELSAMTAVPPAGWRDAAVMAAAADALEERARARRLLSRAGALVVEAPSRGLPAAALAGYRRLGVRAPARR